MSFKEFKEEVEEYVSSMYSSDMKIVTKNASLVPTVDDVDITYANLDANEQKCKLIDTCVLYVDMRSSTDISSMHTSNTLVKLYSSFVSSMIQCAVRCKGRVRGIVGDRVMVVFESQNCFKNAIDTAVLMNSVCKYVINKKFKNNIIKAGIGIDYGQMVAAKTGASKKKKENVHYKSLVWMGMPANVASKLTDMANKTVTVEEVKVEMSLPLFRPDPLVSAALGLERARQEKLGRRVGLGLPPIRSFRSEKMNLDDFLAGLKGGGGEVGTLLTRNPYRLTHPREFHSVKSVVETKEITYPPILMTEAVYKGVCEQNPAADFVVRGDIAPEDVSVSGYDGVVYGCNVHFTDFNPSPTPTP